MKLLLDVAKVKLILSEHRDYIGVQKFAGIDSLIAGIGFLMTIVFTDFSNNAWLRTALIIVAIFYLFYGARQFILSIKYRGFNKDKLLQLLEEINEMEKHPHSIVLIKDDFRDNANKYLVYYDHRWGCKLFLNYHTMSGEDESNIKNIGNHLRMDLKVTTPEGCFLFEETHAKYSASAKTQKTYLHRYYHFKVAGNSEIENDSFTIDGRDYYWMSIAEMESDELIMKYNSDIVALVKEKVNI